MLRLQRHHLDLSGLAVNSPRRRALRATMRLRLRLCLRVSVDAGVGVRRAHRMTVGNVVAL